jgi:DNA-binding response OmpR family regulator
MENIVYFSRNLNEAQVYQNKLSQKGYQITMKNCEGICSEHLFDLEPSFIILDIMPNRNGNYQKIKSIIEYSGRNDVPFIFLLSRNDKILQREAMNLGADDYLIKPVDADTLIDSMNSVIQKHQKRKRFFLELREKILDIPQDAHEIMNEIINNCDEIIKSYPSYTKEEIYQKLEETEKRSQYLHSMLEKSIVGMELQAKLTQNSYPRK